MKQFLPVLKRMRLFAGVGEEEIEMMLHCLGAKSAKYKKGEYVFRQGEYLSYLIVLVEGKLHIQSDDFWGNRSILNVIEIGELFGEAYTSPDSGAILNDVIALEHSTVLLLDIHRILTICPSACKFHSLTVKNLFFEIAEKNRRLVQKLDYMSKRSTREKLIAYLSEEAKRKNSSSFEIPFNRQQLADFLSVDRSAMSNELGKMREEGLLLFQKNRFTLL